MKKRWRCGERACPRVTFTESTEQVPPFARMTTRLKQRVVAACAGEVRAVDAVAGEYGVSWPTVMRQLATAATTRAARDAARPALVSWLGIDEHRFRTMATLSSPAMLTRILNGGLRTLLIDEADRPLDDQMRQRLKQSCDDDHQPWPGPQPPHPPHQRGGVLGASPSLQVGFGRTQPRRRRSAARDQPTLRDGGDLIDPNTGEVF